MVPRRFIRLAIVDAVGRVHAHLTPPGFEDQPTRASAQRILDVGPAEDVAKECARCGGIVGINQGVDAGDHETGLLKSSRTVLFRSMPIKQPVIALGIYMRSLPYSRQQLLRDSRRVLAASEAGRRPRRRRAQAACRIWRQYAIA